MWYVKDLWKTEDNCSCSVILCKTREEAITKFIELSNNETEEFGIEPNAYIDVRKGDYAEYWEDTIERNGFYVEYGPCEIGKIF